MFQVAENWSIVLWRRSFDRSNVFLLSSQEARVKVCSPLALSQPQPVSRSGLIVNNMTSPTVCKVFREGNETLLHILSGERLNGLMGSGQAAKFKPPAGL